VRRISPVLRYSASRDAYVLKVVGRRIGPVFELTQETRSKRSADATPDEIARARERRDAD
jgi:hypothetical protein